MTKMFFINIIAIAAINAILFSSCVKDKEPVADVKLNKAELTLKQGDTAMLIATVYPSDAYNKKVTWKSSDQDVVALAENGIVTALTNGIAIITVTTDDGNKAATCTVKVDYRLKWLGEYKGIHWQKTGSGPLQEYPCSIYVSLYLPDWIDDPSNYDSTIHIKFVSPSEIPIYPVVSDLFTLYKSGSFFSSKWTTGKFYQDSIYARLHFFDDIAYENKLYAKKIKE